MVTNAQDAVAIFMICDDKLNKQANKKEILEIDYVIFGITYLFFVIRFKFCNN